MSETTDRNDPRLGHDITVHAERQQRARSRADRRPERSAAWVRRRRLLAAVATSVALLAVSLGLLAFSTSVILAVWAFLSMLGAAAALLIAVDQ